MKFFDDKSRGELHWYNRNYFYSGTVIFIAVKILLKKKKMSFGDFDIRWALII